MAHCMLPASPSWYCSRVLDSNDCGLTCFGAKHSIYIFDTSTNPPKFHGHIPAHHDRVVSLSFCKFADQKTKLCSASEDGKVKIWDLRDNTLSGEHSEHKHKLSAVHWSTVDKNLIVSADEKGGIVIWQPSSAEIRAICPEPNPVFSITCSAHAANLIAIGYKNGLVLVLDLKRSGSPILQKLRGHDDEIHSIVWCPQADFEAEWRKKSTDTDHADREGETLSDSTSEVVLATGSRDKTIRIWNLHKGKAIYILPLPRNTGQRRVWEDGATKQRVWVTLYWPSNQPSQLVSSSFNGDLVLWDLARPGSKSWQMFGGSGTNTHNRIVFNIASCGPEGHGLCTVSMDRQMICWDLESLYPIHSIPSLGGFVYCIAQSPIHSGRLAVGVGDNLIRIWNVENPQEPYDVKVFWQGIKSKVTALCWHPKREAHLAFGTDDGRVGILDILASRSNISSTYHKRTVYVVSWGPPCCAGDDKPCESEFVLYSCGDGAILQHNPAGLDKNAINVNAVIKKTNNMEARPPGRSEISWKADYSLVSLGNEDGSIEVLRPPSMQLLCTVQVHHKLVNCVRWHPEYTAQSVEPSPCQFWLASGSNEAVIHIVNVQKSIEAAEAQGSPVVITESFCQLEGHTNRITGLSWSTHNEGRLVSASYDWTAQVWDVKKCEPVANFRAHHGRLLSVLWSSLDPNVVYSGGDDFTIQAWNISDQAHKTPPAGSEKRKHRNKPKSARTKPQSDPPIAAAPRSVDQGCLPEVSKPAGTALDNGAGGGDIMAEIQALLDLKKSELTEAAKDHPEQTETDVVAETPEGTHLKPTTSSKSYPKPVADASPSKKDNMKKDVKEKAKRKARSLFPLSSTMDNRGKLHTQDDCVDLMIAKATSAESPVELPKSQCHLGHFVDRQNSYQLFDHEIVHHLEQGNYDQYLILEAFKGDIGQGVQVLADKTELSDFTVAMAAMASAQTWRSTCISYAKQLEKEGNYPKAASYLLAAQQVYEAIDLLKRNSHYKDAVCLARARLSPHDPVIRGLYASWGNQLASDGNFELAAKCYIANDQPIEAARLLARRADLSALRVASEICLNSGDLLNARVYCLKHTQQCMMALDWVTAAQLIKKHKQLKLHGLMLSTHQVLMHSLSAVDCLSDIDVTQGAMYTVDKKPGPSGDDKLTLPLLFLNEAEINGWLPWRPYAVQGQAMVTYLLRQWHEHWDLGLDLDTLRAMDEQLTVLSQTRQQQTALKQVLIELANLVTMSVVKLLLGDIEAAAHWMTVSIAMCEDSQLHKLSQGLCQILLPTGPGQLVKLMQQLRALRHVAVQTTVEDLDSSPTKPSSITESFTSAPHVCSSVGCLQAFYYHTVVRYMISKDLEGKGNPSDGQIECNISNTTGSNILSKDPRAPVVGSPAVTSLREMSQSLLLTSMVRKKNLLKTLAQIRRATAALISLHSETKSISTETPPNSDSESTQERTIVYPSTPNIGDISLDAFQKENRIILSKTRKTVGNGDTTNVGDSKDSALRLLIPRTVKPHEWILNSPLKSPNYFPLTRCNTDPEELTKMHSMEQGDAEVLHEASLLDPLPEALTDEAITLSDQMSENDIAENKICSTASHNMTNAGSAESSKSPEPNHELPRMSSDVAKSADSDVTDTLCYPGVPEEWYKMPLDRKYIQGYVNLPLLSAEQKRIQRELTELNKHAKQDSPFPDPEQSVLTILELSKLQEKSPDLETFVDELYTWGHSHCYSQKTLLALQSK